MAPDAPCLRDGYEPDHFGDGKYHAIEVKVKREGVTLRHREGYLDKTAGDRLLDRTTAGLLVGSQANPLGLRLAVAHRSSGAPTQRAC